MSIDQSFLSSPRYGYPVVVATTQISINATMKAYLAGLTQPLVEICYVADAAGNPQWISLTELKQRSGGVDPFQVPADADPNTDPALLALRNARFMVGFKARIGLPPGIAPLDMPDIVVFGNDYSNVTFRLMCAEFLVVSLKPGGGYSPATWLSVQQPEGKPWMFTSIVNLREVTVGSDKYNTLPPEVQKAISGFNAGTFGVQQLLFDLDNAALQSIPTMSGVEPGSALYMVLQQDFLGTYFSQMQEDGQPVLGCTITRIGPDRSSLNITNVQMQLGPFVDGDGQIVPDPTRQQRDLATLNYLCAVNNESPLPPVPFAWNWLEGGEGVDGVVALNRNVFAAYIKDQVFPYAIRCCILPWVRVWLDGLYVCYSWSGTPYQTPSVTMNPSGETVLTMSYSAKDSDEAGLWGAAGEMELSTNYDMSVKFTGNKIIIAQSLKIYTYIRVAATGSGGNVVDKTVTSTYTLGVDAQGNLTAVLSSETRDDSKTPGVNGFLDFFTNFNEFARDVKKWASDISEAKLKDLPLAIARSFVFPGGNTFVFKDVIFSENQDLVSRITYADPSLHLTKLGRAERPKARILLSREESLQPAL
ncbi:hypothetical protein HMPREF9946_02509 [Acetobacteraceae bacterium AT-5844]|nr:hypothetical protein HMPREF9946_02509 [Acetobacteraceae bacterium AT-5844]